MRIKQAGRTFFKWIDSWSGTSSIGACICGRGQRDGRDGAFWFLHSNTAGTGGCLWLPQQSPIWTILRNCLTAGNILKNRCSVVSKGIPFAEHVKPPRKISKLTNNLRNMPDKLLNCVFTNSKAIFVRLWKLDIVQG